MILTIRILQICVRTDGDGECNMQLTIVYGAPDTIISTFVRFLSDSFLAKFMQDSDFQLVNCMLVFKNVIQLLFFLSQLFRPKEQRNFALS